jgi:hypothetical protein
MVLVFVAPAVLVLVATWAVERDVLWLRFIALGAMLVVPGSLSVGAWAIEREDPEVVKARTADGPSPATEVVSVVVAVLPPAIGG